MQYKDNFIVKINVRICLEKKSKKCYENNLRIWLQDLFFGGKKKKKN